MSPHPGQTSNLSNPILLTSTQNIQNVTLHESQAVKSSLESFPQYLQSGTSTTSEVLTGTSFFFMYSIFDLSLIVFRPHKLSSTVGVPNDHVIIIPYGSLMYIVVPYILTWQKRKRSPSFGVNKAYTRKQMVPTS